MVYHTYIYILYLKQNVAEKFMKIIKEFQLHRKRIWQFMLV